MAIIQRLSRLFLADFHSVLDHIEEPESLLKQALREMEEELEQSEKRIKCIEATLRQIVLQVLICRLEGVLLLLCRVTKLDSLLQLLGWQRLLVLFDVGIAVSLQRFHSRGVYSLQQ